MEGNAEAQKPAERFAGDDGLGAAGRRGCALLFEEGRAEGDHLVEGGAVVAVEREESQLEDPT